MTDFTIAPIFSSNMVLQREKNIRVFGTGKNGEKVEVELAGMTVSTCIRNGRWEVLLPPQQAGTGLSMTIVCGKEQIQFLNVAIGEVWLAGGQSNMEYELQNSTGAAELMASPQTGRVRYYHTNKMAHMDEDFYAKERETEWEEYSQDKAGSWSAVGYLFAEEIASRLNVVVGIIGCNWGGTSAACWISEQAVCEDQELAVYWEEYYDQIGDLSVEEQLEQYREYQRYHQVWEAKSASLYQEDPDITWDRVQEILGTCQWPGPKCVVNPYRPSGLYTTMLSRLAPYTLRGFLYYQGEEDEKKPWLYQKLLTRLIRQWRTDWKDQELPFLLVQLPMHQYRDHEEDKSWCLLREAQMNTYKTIKNTGIAVIADCGEYNEIHPKDKRQVGYRLALQALFQVYGQIGQEHAFGPVFRTHVPREKELELHFDYCQGGFEVRSDISAFEIAEDGEHYYPAQFRIQGEKIILWSEQVERPTVARYCWSNYCDVPLFGHNGLPLAPFRTGE